MRGHEFVIEARRQRLAPSFVAITGDRVETFGPDGSAIWVHVDPADNLNRIDLRFVMGLRTLVMAADQTRREAITEACRKAGAVLCEYVEDPYAACA